MDTLASSEDRSNTAELWLAMKTDQTPRSSAFHRSPLFATIKINNLQRLGISDRNPSIYKKCKEGIMRPSHGRGTCSLVPFNSIDLLPYSSKIKKNAFVPLNIEFVPAQSCTFVPLFSK